MDTMMKICILTIAYLQCIHKMTTNGTTIPTAISTITIPTTTVADNSTTTGTSETSAQTGTSFVSPTTTDSTTTVNNNSDSTNTSTWPTSTDSTENSTSPLNASSTSNTTSSSNATTSSNTTSSSNTNSSSSTATEAQDTTDGRHKPYTGIEAVAIVSMVVVCAAVIGLAVWTARCEKGTSRMTSKETMRSGKYPDQTVVKAVGVTKNQYVDLP